MGDEVNTLYLYRWGSADVLGRNTGAHGQGVCELVWIGDREILSGSFDGTVARICIDDFGVVRARVQLGGTIWRIIPIFGGRIK